MINIPDSPERTAGPGELPHEQPRRQSDPDARSVVYDDAMCDCDATWEARKEKLEAQSAEAHKIQAMLIARYRAAHRCSDMLVGGVCIVCDKPTEEPSIMDIMQNIKSLSERINNP